MEGKVKLFVVLSMAFLINCSRQMAPVAPPPVLETETTSLADHAPVPAATEEVSKRKRPHLAPPPIQLGAEQLREYLPLLKDKAVGLVVNHTSMVGPTHLADTLLALGIRVEKIFAPEHGFRGAADAGETISDGREPRILIRQQKRTLCRRPR